MLRNALCACAGHQMLCYVMLRTASLAARPGVAHAYACVCVIVHADEGLSGHELPWAISRVGTARRLLKHSPHKDGHRYRYKAKVRFLVRGTMLVGSASRREAPSLEPLPLPARLCRERPLPTQRPTKP